MFPLLSNFKEVALETLFTNLHMFEFYFHDFNLITISLNKNIIY